MKKAWFLIISTIVFLAIFLLFNLAGTGKFSLAFGQAGGGNAGIDDSTSTLVTSGKDKIDIEKENKDLQDKNIGTRMNALRKLSRARNKTASKELIAQYKREKDSNFRAKIVEALATAKDTDTVRGIVDVMKTEKSVIVKSAAVTSLGSIGGDEAITALRGAFLNEKENLGLRISALESLSRFQDNKLVFDTLVVATENKSPVIRRTSAGFLWQNYYPGKKDIIEPILKELLKDSDEKVKNSAKGMLEYKPPK